ncbi:MAG: HEAT repeat domain-containing protein [bacterium]
MERSKNVNLCKNILMLIGVILLVLCPFSHLGANEKDKNRTEWIEIARKIQKIEEISDLKSKISIDSMVIYLNDEEPLIRRIAAEKIGYIGDENMIVYLDKDDPYWCVRSACQDIKKMINIKRMLDSPSITELEKKQLIKKLVKDDLKSSVIIMKLYIEEKKVKTLEEISKEISELQSVLRLYEFDMKRALEVSLGSG